MSGLPISRAEIEECQEAVNNFRVNELNLLLTSYHYPKLGKKQDLVQRAKSILLNPKFQVSAVQKVREIQTSNRLRQIVAPYSIPSSSSSSTSSEMRRQQFLGNPNTVSRSAMLHQAVNNMGSQFGSGQNLAASAPNAFPALFNQFQSGVNSTHHQPNVYSAGNFGYPGMPSGGLSGSAVLPTARNLRMISLPFYDMKSIVIPLTELPSFNVQPRPGEARHHLQFGFAPDEIAKLMYKSDDRPLPRYEVQFRVFQLDTSKEQEDAFPPGCIVKLDDFNVTLPNVIPTNKPNAEQKRLSRPVNLTPYCQPPRSRDRPHRMLIEWSGDKRAWAFGIFIVFRVNTDILQQRLMQNLTARRSFQNTKSIIIRRLNGDDDDGIEMDALKISLLCPLMRTRIKLPARAMDCTHLQFFDLTNYLMMCEKRPVWKCPVCENQAPYSKLIIDQYFQKVIETADKSVDEVELLKDGTWRVFQEEMVDLSEDDDEVVLATTSKKKVHLPVKSEGENFPKKSEKNFDYSRVQSSPTIVDLDALSEQPVHSGSATVKTNGLVPEAPLAQTVQSGIRIIFSGESTAPSSAQLPDCEIITLSDSDDESDNQRAVSDNGDDDNQRPVSDNGNNADINAGAISDSGEEEDNTRALNDNGEKNDNSRAVSVSTDKDDNSQMLSVNADKNHNDDAALAVTSKRKLIVSTRCEDENIAHRQNNAQLIDCDIITLSDSGDENDNPVLQTNGFHPPVFHSIIEDVAKAHVAKELATFLQSVCAKNSATHMLPNS